MYGSVGFTTDTDTDNVAQSIVARYAHRWPIETAIAAGKQTLGIGQALNRLARAVERTGPFEFVVYSLVIVWYAHHGHHRDDLAARRADEPWYRSRTNQPSKIRALSSAETLPPHKLPELPQLNPTPTNTAITNWPAPQGRVTAKLK